MRLVTWNVKGLHNRSGSLITAARELERHKLDLVCVQEFVGGQSGHGYRRGYILVREWKGNINSEQNILYNTEYYQQLMEQSLLVVHRCVR
jgi:hypothetical protein